MVLHKFSLRLFKSKVSFSGPRLSSSCYCDQAELQERMYFPPLALILQVGKCMTLNYTAKEGTSGAAGLSGAQWRGSIC